LLNNGCVLYWHQALVNTMLMLLLLLPLLPLLLLLL
jgi:hypothetical protein